MLGEPVADIAEAVGMARQVDAVAQRRGGFCAGRDDGEVENGKRNHRDKLVWGISRTKAPMAQIRRARKGARTRPSGRSGGTHLMNL